MSPSPPGAAAPSAHRVSTPTALPASAARVRRSAAAAKRLIDTRAALSRYVTSDPIEAAFGQRMLALIEVEGDPFSRRWEVPGHFTASAFVLSPDERELLLIRHRKLRRWLQPGGHFEAQDDGIEAAARREVAEETGLAAMSPLTAGLFDVDVHDIPPHGGDPGHAHFDLRMAFRAHTWALADTDEVDDVRWVPLREVARLETDASVLRAVGRLIHRLRDRSEAEIIGSNGGDHEQQPA